MAKKHKHPEHVNHERWLVSYADFITLLFATFTALYALSRSDADKAKALAESVRISFGESANTLIAKAALDFIGIPSDKPTPAPNKKNKDGEGKGEKQYSDHQAEKAEMVEMKNDLQTQMMALKMLGKVETEVSTRGLVLTLREAGFFTSGKAELVDSSAPALAAMAAEISRTSNPIRIEGHTDSIPMSSRTFPTNWDLSTARATAIVRVLVERYGINPSRLSAIGYGEYKPVASNATAGGRSRNRRVDVVILTPDAARLEPKAMQEGLAPDHSSEIWENKGDFRAADGISAPLP